MNTDEMVALIRKGESSIQRFMENVHNELAIAQEIIAFANTSGGTILIGVNDKTWEPTGITREDVNRLNNLIVNAAEQQVKPT